MAHMPISRFRTSRNATMPWGGVVNLPPGTAATNSLEKKAVIREVSTVHTRPATIPQMMTRTQLILPISTLWQVKSSTEAASPFRFGEIEFEGYVPIKIRSLPQKEGAVPSAGEDGVNAFSYGSARNCRTGLWSSFFATT